MDNMAYTKEKQLQRKEHFTSDIDQDPKKQLVIDVKPVTALSLVFQVSNHLHFSA